MSPWHAIRPCNPDQKFTITAQGHTVCLRFCSALFTVEFWIYILWHVKVGRGKSRSKLEPLIKVCCRVMVNFRSLLHECGPEGAVGTATRYGRDGPQIEFRWGRGFPHPSKTEPKAHPTSWRMEILSLSWGKVDGIRPSVSPPPHLVPRLKKKWSCNSVSGPAQSVIWWIYLLQECIACTVD